MVRIISYSVKTTGKQYWEIIADQLHEAGWSYGYSQAIVRDLGDVWIADAIKNGHRYIVQAPTLMTAFIELQKVTRKADGYFVAT